METNEFVSFVRKHGLGVVATLGPNGTPQAAVVAILATDLGEVVFGCERGSRKFANIQRHPAVALAIGWDSDEITVQCEGIADEPAGADSERCLQYYLDRFPRETELVRSRKLALVRVRMNWIRYADTRPETFRWEETFPGLGQRPGWRDRLEPPFSSKAAGDEISNELRLRPATPSDSAMLYALHKATMRQYAEAIYGPWDDAFQLARHEEWLRNSDPRVIQYRDEAVGVVDWLWHERELYLGRIEVRPDHQRTGIGTKVIKHVAAIAAERSKPLVLEVIDINPARHLYERLGFEPFKTVGHKIHLRLDTSGMADPTGPDESSAAHSNGCGGGGPT